MHPVDAAFAARCREVRKGRGMTQQELSDAVGISRATLSKIEGGFRGGIRLWEAAQTASALGVTVDQLMSGEPLTIEVEIA